MIKLAILFIFMVSTTVSAADKIIIEESDSYWGHPVIVKGTHIYGGSPEVVDLEDAVKDNPAALKYAQEASHYRTAFWITFVPWLGSLALGLITQDPTTGWISLGVFVGASIPLIHFESRTRYFLFKTINTYNGNDTDSQTENQTKLDLGIHVASEGPRLNLSLNF
jgi:hypothetical protein